MTCRFMDIHIIHLIFNDRQATIIIHFTRVHENPVLKLYKLISYIHDIVTSAVQKW